MEHVIIVELATVLSHFGLNAIVDTQQVIPEGRDHKELLHHTVHVAYAAEIPDPNVCLHPLALRTGRGVVPLVWLFDRVHEGFELVLEEALHGLWRFFD